MHKVIMAKTTVSGEIPVCMNKLMDDILGLDAPKAQIIAPPKQPTRQDSKSPDTAATIDRAQQTQNAMSGGIANTLYTDATGVEDDQLRLGKKTLLGG